MLVGDKRRKIKVVRIITRLNIGGPSIHAILLNDGLDKDTFETYLIAGSPGISEGDMAWLAGQAGINVIYVPELSRELGFKDIIALFKIFGILKKIRPDIIHTHMAKAGALGRMAALLAGVPVRVHTFHGHVLDGYFSAFKTTIFLAVERFLAQFTDKVISISYSLREEIVEKLRIVSGDKCVVIKLGFDLKKFLDVEKKSGVFRQKIGVSYDMLLVGIVGRLVPIKNHKMFLDVVKCVVDRGGAADTMFVIVGGGQLESELTRYAHEIGVEDFVRFAGWVQDVSSVYADLDIAVLTSINEGTPVSLIEAMASSRPVVSTDVGAVRDIVSDGENGFLVEKDNVRDFSDKLCRLIKDKGLRLSFGSIGRKRVMVEYLKDRLIADISGLYKEIIYNKRGARQ